MRIQTNTTTGESAARGDKTPGQTPLHPPRKEDLCPEGQTHGPESSHSSPKCARVHCVPRDYSRDPFVDLPGHALTLPVCR